MKKLITNLITIGLITSSMTVAIMPPKRFAQCIWNSKEYNCSDKEKKEVKIWVGTASIGAIIALLALIGVTVGPKAAQKIKEYQTESDIEKSIETLRNELRENALAIEKKRKAIELLQNQSLKDPNNEQINNNITTLETEITQLTQKNKDLQSDIASRISLQRTVGKY